ncbi:MAG: TIGR04282 family arsenosugar biosynthesis glycosyltransferase [Eubacteriales bacterium]|jgi:hypothetical protein
MSRVPSPEGKSRLSGILSPEQREALQWALLEDTIEKAAQLPELEIFLSLTPASQIDRMKMINLEGAQIIVQPDGGLGKRMLAAIQQLFGRNYAPVILTGTDIPALSPEHLAKALDLLEDYQLVIGPAKDGGYYLMGMKYPEDRIFEDISWGSHKVLEETLTSCDRFGIRYYLLDLIGDIDRPEDLLGFMDDIDQEEKLFSISKKNKTIQLLKLWKDEIQ